MTPTGNWAAALDLPKWRQWLTVCLRLDHDWRADPSPNDEQAEYGNLLGAVWTPSSTCTRCGARSF